MKSKKEVLKMYKDIDRKYKQLKSSKYKALDKHISQKERDEIGYQMRLICTSIELLISDVFDP